MDLDGVITKDTGGWTSDYYSSCSPNMDTISLMKKLNYKQWRKREKMSNQNQNNIDWITELGRDIVEGRKEIIRKRVRKQVNSGVLYLPKEHTGKKAVIIIFNGGENEEIKQGRNTEKEE